MIFGLAYKVLTLADSIEWNNHLSRLPIELQDIYFTPEYYRLYEERDEGIAQCFVFEDSKGHALYPFLKNSVNSLGYRLDKEYYDIQGAYGYNGILSSEGNSFFFDSFYNAFSNYCVSENIITEFTRFHPLLHNQSFSVSYMDVILDRETVFLDLHKPYNNIWLDEYSSKNRNMVRKAQKLGYNIQVIETPNELDIDAFIKIYIDSMNAAKAEPYYYFDRNFFFNTFKYLGDSVLLFNVVDNSGEIVCSSLFINYGDYFHYHLSGRISNADNSVNNFLIDRVIAYAQARGSRFIHLGGGRSNSVNDSLLKYKKSFSSQSLQFYIGKRIYNTDVYNEVVQQWEQRFPEKKEVYRNRLLKYRD